MNVIAAFERLQTPAPIPTRISQPFWDAAAQRVLRLQRCEHCGLWVFYPRAHCPHCWSDRLVWADASGQGRIKAFSVVHKPGHAAWREIAPYALGVIALREGPCMLSTLPVRDLRLLTVGLPVRVCFVTLGQFTLPMFQPYTESPA